MQLLASGAPFVGKGTGFGDFGCAFLRLKSVVKLGNETQGLGCDVWGLGFMILLAGEDLLAQELMFGSQSMRFNAWGARSNVVGERRYVVLALACNVLGTIPQGLTPVMRTMGLV